MMEWRLVDSGSLPPEEIMSKDAALLEGLQSSPYPLLHFYDWKGDCATHGYFTNPADYLHLSEVEASGLHLARRPTGGGIIFHLTDFAFSLLVPAAHPHFSLNTLDNYAYINRKIAQAIGRLTGQQVQPELWMAALCSQDRSCSSFCMAQPTPYDLMIQGKKVGGAAQRRTRWGYLHQGSLSLTPPPYDLLEKVIKDPSILRAMQQHTYPLREVSGIALAAVRQEIKAAIQREFTFL